MTQEINNNNQNEGNVYQMILIDGRVIKVSDTQKGTLKRLTVKVGEDDLYSVYIPTHLELTKGISVKVRGLYKLNSDDKATYKSIFVTDSDRGHSIQIMELSENLLG